MMFIGLTDVENRTIWIDARLGPRERRCTMVHGLLHAIRGDDTDDPNVETTVAKLTAALLVTEDQLAEALAATTDADRLCQLLDIDMGTLRTRLRYLPDAAAERLGEAFVSACSILDPPRGAILVVSS